MDRQLLGVNPGKTMHLLSGRHEGLTCEVRTDSQRIQQHELQALETTMQCPGVRSFCRRPACQQLQRHLTNTAVMHAPTFLEHALMNDNINCPYRCWHWSQSWRAAPIRAYIVPNMFSS